MYLNAIRENKILAKISKFTVFAAEYCSCFCCRLQTFFSKLKKKKKKKKKNHHFQETYQSVESFGSRPGPTCCWFWSGSKLFAKVISSRSKENVEGCKRK